MIPIKQDSELDRLWPAEELLGAVGFRVRAHNRISHYLHQRGLTHISPRQVMDLFVPAPPFSAFSPYLDAPICRQSQFGKYCYNSALLSLSEAKLGSAFQHEWALRLYYWKVAEIRASPGNRASQSSSNTPC